MNITIKQIKHLALNSYQEQGDIILVIGNAYGIMPYVEPLATTLNQAGYSCYWFAFSGQNETAGTFAFDNCTHDLNLIVEHLSKQFPEKKINIIAHCAGGLMTMEYCKRYGTEKLHRIIFYGLLYAPYRRRQIAERKLRQCKVNYSLAESDWYYNVLGSLPAVTVPVMFCHAKDRLNMERGNREEMEGVKNACSCVFRWYEEGYDENIGNIQSFAADYIHFLKGDMK